MKLWLVMLCGLVGTASAATYSVVAPENPRPWETSAARELRDYLARRVAGDVTIAGAAGVRFHVGDTRLAAEKGLLSKSLPDEKWVIRSFGSDVLLNGGGTRGALYAVSHFLEDQCGVHWWSEYEDHVPPASPLALPALDRSGQPALVLRDIYRTCQDARGARFAVLARLNRTGDLQIPAEWGGSMTYGPPYHVHTFDHYVPFATYGKSHPEYFSLRNGRRVGGVTEGQLCLTNPDLRGIFLTNLLAFVERGIDEAKRAGVPPPRMYDVSMNDNHGICQCAACSREIAAYNASGHYLRFVNALAAEVAKIHPEVFITTLAYFFTEPPPKGGVRAADNVIVKLCDTQTNQASSILDDENALYRNFVSSWKAFARNIVVWDYSVVFSKNTTGLPFPSEFHYGDLYRFYWTNNVRGVFWEHEYPHLADMYELKVFLEAKLAEDPMADAPAIIETFMTCYYGAAAPHLMKYRRELDAVRRANRGVVHWFPTIGSFNYITDADLIRFEGFFEDALSAVAGDELRRARVGRARFGLDRLLCARAERLPYHGPKGTDTRLDASAAWTRLRTDWTKWNARYPGSDDKTEEMRTWLKAAPGQARLLPVPEQFANARYHELTVRNFGIHDAAAISLQDDPESPAGRAFRIEVGNSAQRYYDLPFQIGYYDIDAKKTLALATFEKIAPGTGYQWYRLGRTKISPSGYVFVTRAWTIQAPIDYPELVGREMDIWVSARHAGPGFRAGDKGPDRIWIDRMIFVEPSASGN